jgi:hypothetical protein
MPILSHLSGMSDPVTIRPRLAAALLESDPSHLVRRLLAGLPGHAGREEANGYDFEQSEPEEREAVRGAEDQWDGQRPGGTDLGWGVEPRL